jgi:hypothetical protein
MLPVPEYIRMCICMYERVCMVTYVCLYVYVFLGIELLSRKETKTPLFQWFSAARRIL